MITASINLSKVDKSRLYEGKTGDKYLNVVIWVNDQEDNYGNNVSIQQSITQQEKNAGVKSQYIGNGKTYDQQKKTGGMPKSEAFNDKGNDDLPW